MTRIDQQGDLIIDGKPYMLARSGDHVGARSWQERGPQVAEMNSQLDDVSRGEIGKELRIRWETKHKGFGEPVRQIMGRDYYGRNIDKRYPKQVSLARDITTLTPGVTAGGDPAGFAQFGGALYLAYGRYTLKIDSSDAISTSRDHGAGNLSTGIAAFGGFLLTALGEADPFEHTADGTTWTAHAGGFTATHFQVAENRLYRSFEGVGGGNIPAYISNTEDDPTSSLNWSAEDPIGDVTIPITGMANVAYQVFIAKEDGLYAADIETGRFPSLTPELAPWRHPNNGRGVHGWGGQCFYPTIRGLKMFLSGVLFTAGPEQMSQNDSEVRGRITGLAGDANWLFAALYNGTDTYILAGRNPRMDDGYPGEFLWNVVWYVSGGPYTAMAISGLNNDPRLWLARQGAVHYIKLGNQLDNPLQDAGAVFASSGVDYYPAHDGGSPMVDKHFVELRTYCENLSQADGREIVWDYRLDDDTAWTPLGTSRFSPVSVIKFPAVGNIGRRVQLRATWARGSDTGETPVLRSVEVLCVEYPPNRKVITAQVMLVDKVQLRSGSDHRSALEILRDLEQLVTNRKLVSLQDPMGRQRQVLPIGPVLTQEIGQTDTRPPLMLATIQYLVLNG